MAASAHPIVQQALQLQQQCPTLSALEILDQACQGHEGEDPNFESCDPVTGRRPHPAYSDETDPHSPFGALLCRAFAPNLDARELLLLTLEERSDPSLASRINQIAEVWQSVIEQFAARYRLWEGGL